MQIKFNKMFYGALLIFRDFYHLKRSMFTKSLNCETYNLLAAKRPVYQWQGLFCFMFSYLAFNFSSY